MVQYRLSARKVSEGRIAKVASDLMMRKGVDAVTMRSVATACGVTPMAIYSYYDSSAEMRRAGVDIALRVVRNPPFEGSVATRLRQWCHAARKVLRRHPDLAAVCLTDWPELPEGCRIMEGLLVVAAEHRAGSADQVQIANTVFIYVLTRVIAEHAMVARRTQRSLPAVEATPRRFARLVEVQSEFKRLDVDRDFATGLDALLAGLLR